MVIRSHSGDTDILVLGVSLFPEGERIFLDNGTGKSRKLIWFGNFEFSTGRRNALLGFHAFTGNDYNASFFRKSKVTCWKILANNSKFEDTFSALGEHLEISDYLNSSLEEYVCRLYRYSEKSVNCVRYKMFEKKQCRENKIPDLSTLAPCHQVLQYHIKRSSAITYIWKQSLATNVDGK